MASRKSKTIVFRLPTGSKPSTMKAGIEGELDAGVVIQELLSKEILLKLTTQEHAEQLISDGFFVNEVHVQPSLPTGQFIWVYELT